MTLKGTILNNEITHRFEMQIGGETAYIPYRIFGDTLTLYFIFVPLAFRGRGHSGELIRYAIDFANERELRIEVHCSFISRYLALHPDLRYQTAVEEE